MAVFSASQQVLRGAVFFPQWSFMFGPSLSFLDRQITIRGPRISWQKTWPELENLSTEVGLRYLRDGNPPFTLGSDFDEETDYRASRSDSLESFLNLHFRFGFRELFAVSLNIVPELHRHRGFFYQLGFTAPLYRFISLETRIGTATASHNEYIYGEGASSGFTHQDLNLSYFYPKLLGARFLLQLQQSWILQTANRQADRVRGNGDQIVLRCGLIWELI